MVMASGTRVGLSYVAETTHGVTPDTPTMKALRATSRNVNLKRNTLQTAEVRSDRQISDFRHGFNRVEGNAGWELSMHAFDDMLEFAFANTWATAAVTTGTATLSVDGTAKTITRASGSFVTDGFKVGDFVTVSGYTTAANNGRMFVTSVAALALGVAPSLGTALVTEAGGGDELVVRTGDTLAVGANTLKTFTMERRFTDISRYQVYKGCAVNTMSWNVVPEQMVGGSMEIVGMSALDMQSSSLGTPTAAPTFSPFSAFEGSLYLEGTAQAVITGMTFNINNGRQLSAVVGSKFSPDVFEGQANIDGQITAFLEDSTAFYDLFHDEAEIEIGLRLDDVNGAEFMGLFMPRVKLLAGDIDPPQEGPITIVAPFKALYSGTADTTLRLQRSSAAA